MKTSFEEKDWETLQGLAHQVKGTAGSLGFPDLTTHANHLEMALRNEESDPLDRRRCGRLRPGGVGRARGRGAAFGALRGRLRVHGRPR